MRASLGRRSSPREGRGNCATTVLLLAAFVAFPATVHAYIDPGYGALFVQVLLSGLVGALFFARKAVRALVVGLPARLRWRRRERSDAGLASDREQPLP
jgi:hypothetical protein